MENTGIKAFTTQKKLGFVVYSNTLKHYWGIVGEHKPTIGEETVAVLADSDILIYTVPPTPENPGHSDKIPEELLQLLRERTLSGYKGPLYTHHFPAAPALEVVEKYQYVNGVFWTLYKNDQAHAGTKRDGTFKKCKLSSLTRVYLKDSLIAAAKYLNVLDPQNEVDRTSGKEMMEFFATVFSTSDAKKDTTLVAKYEELRCCYALFQVDCPKSIAA